MAAWIAAASAAVEQSEPYGGIVAAAAVLAPAVRRRPPVIVMSAGRRLPRSHVIAGIQRSVSAHNIILPAVIPPLHNMHIAQGRSYHWIPKKNSA